MISFTRGEQMKSYTDRIKELREDNDMTQSSVAAALGTTQQVYSRYENGQNELPIRHLIALAKLYNVSTDYILCLKNNKEM